MDFHHWSFFLLNYLGFAAAMYVAAWLFIRLGSRREQASMAMAASPQVRARFQPYMEGLRGLMAINIFYFHATGWYDWKHGGTGYPSDTFNEKVGAVALCYFLFMTGYLIWKGVIDFGSTFHPVRFLKGRFYRTFPAYAVVITLIFVTALGVSGWKLQVPLWKFIASYASWLMFALPGGFAINGISDVGTLGARVMWTMQTDWMYYLLLPFLLWFGRKRGRILILTAISIAVFLLVQHYCIGRNGIYHRVVLFTFCYTGCFLVGMLLAELQHLVPEWRWARSASASVAAVLIYFGLLYLAIPSWSVLQQALFLPVFVLLAYGCSVFGLFNQPPVLLLGRVSYSVYLFHAWVLIMVSHIMGALGHAPEAWPRQQYLYLTTAVGVLVLVMSWLSHRYIEVPFTTLGKLRAARRAVGSAARPTPAEVEAAVQEEAAQLPGMAEAEAILPQHAPRAIR